MEIMQAARNLGRAIQEDERYKSYVSARNENDNDKELQEIIGKFNLLRQNLNLEMSKPDGEKNADAIASMNKELQDTYAEIMGNVNMANFTVTKNAMDSVMNTINIILQMCCEGADPDTCEPSECSGSCGSCGGCS